MKKIPHSRSIPLRVQHGSLDKGVLPPAFETDHLTLSRAKHRLSSYLYLFAIFRNSVVLSEGFPFLKDFLLHLATECCWLWYHSMMFLNFELHVKKCNATDNRQKQSWRGKQTVEFCSCVCRLFFAFCFHRSDPIIKINTLKLFLNLLSFVM